MLERLLLFKEGVLRKNGFATINFDLLFKGQKVRLCWKYNRRKLIQMVDQEPDNVSKIYDVTLICTFPRSRDVSGCHHGQVVRRTHIQYHEVI